ncbi:MAG: hypothetical protein C0507_14750 [Cyanobacteria bacterium PR.3.49]|nr:hypothetical protein [Cyanobacteria bacterium PR.3.49]
MLRFSTVLLVVFVLLFGCTEALAKKKGNDGSLRIQSQNYDEETGKKEKDATAEALTKVPGKLSNVQLGKTAKNRAERVVNKAQDPVNTHKQGKAKTQGQANGVGNAAADIARDQAVSAIDYCSRFMKNFTTEGGNRWSRFRDQFFLPMALLLILPGAVLTQVRAIIAQSNPVVGQASPLEGLQRSIITVFLVPATYLVTNYAIDLGNSLHYSICTEYQRIMGSDMYRDAMCAEIRAFGVRYQSENEGSLKVPDADLSPRGSEPFAEIEGTLWGKLADPCTGIYLVPANRDDAAMPQSSIAVRMGMFTANAGICAGWACLTAFQMAFFYYLYLVGPIMAALWAWPMKTFRDALPNWVEGCVTLAFWSFFWHVTIAIIAITKSQESTGLYMVTALNVLATCSVKHAFDFAGVMRSAAGQFEQIGAECAANAQGGGGGGGGKGGSKGKGKGQNAKQNTGAPQTGDAPSKVAESPTSSPVPLAARASAKLEQDVANKNSPRKVQPILTAALMKPMAQAIVDNGLPPAAAVCNLQPMQTAALATDPSQNMFNDLNANPAVATTYNTTLNQFCGWNNPIASPPSSGQMVMRSRNTIGSQIGNSIQEVMVYPTSVPIKDPDQFLQHLSNEIKEPQNVNSVTKNQDHNTQEQTMNSPRNLLARLQTVAGEAQSFAPPAPAAVQVIPSQPFVGFTRLEELQFSCQPQDGDENIVTVADFRNLNSAASTAQQQPQANLNQALGNVLRTHGAWAQSQQPVRAAESQVTTSWWS